MAEIKEAPRPKTENGYGQNKNITPRTTPAPTRSIGSPFGYMRRFAEEMDNLFENFAFQTGLRMPSFLTRSHELLRREAGFIPGEWSPQIAVSEGDGQIVVHADLPGLSKEEVTVDITDNLLTIQGERKEQKKEERGGCTYNECRYGSFYRAVPLPAGADSSKATAQFRNGVLEVTVPAPVQSGKQPRRLEVRDGS